MRYKGDSSILDLAHCKMNLSSVYDPKESEPGFHTYEIHVMSLSKTLSLIWHAQGTFLPKHRVCYLLLQWLPGSEELQEDIW